MRSADRRTTHAVKSRSVAVTAVATAVAAQSGVGAGSPGRPIFDVSVVEFGVTLSTRKNSTQEENMCWRTKGWFRRTHNAQTKYTSIE
jgi:hypothetical protein